MTSTFSRWPQSLSCSMAAARNVSHAASSADSPRDCTRCASLAAVVVLPVPFTPTIETTVRPSGAARSSGWLEARLLPPPRRDGEHVHARAALRFVSSS